MASSNTVLYQITALFPRHDFESFAKKHHNLKMFHLISSISTHTGSRRIYNREKHIISALMIFCTFFT